MPLKKKFKFLLSNRRPKQLVDEALQIEQDEAKKAQQASQTQKPSVPGEDAALLELPTDHPLRYLRDLWYRETGSSASLRLRMEINGEEELPPEVLKKEKSRLQSSLKGVCTSRWKTIRQMNAPRRGPKNKEEDEPEEPFVMDALVWLFISSDKLWVWMLVLPPVNEGEELSKGMIDQELSAQGVSYGLDDELLDRLPQDQERYFTLRLIARGKPAFDGKNGNIVDRVPRKIERALKVNEYGQVDYASLNMVRSVKEGQEICCLIKPTEGEPGRNVLDQELPARSGANARLPKGRNTEITEDGEALIASISGQVSFTNNAFQVKPVLDIDGNVDFSTGNIKFVGDVNIKGDVTSGFKVHVMGNVFVGGVVEAGASVEAGGDLTVVKGILGDGTTIIRASGCVFSKYVENSTICVRENLQTDCMVNSRIYCGGEVIVRSGRGSIKGGQTWAGRRIDANSVGAHSEIKTCVILGGQPCASFDIEMVRQELRDLSQEMKRLEEQPDNPTKAAQIGKVRMKRSVASLKLSQLEEDAAAPGEKNTGRMECDVAHPGTEITIGEEFLRLRHEIRQCSAKLLYGEITLA